MPRPRCGNDPRAQLTDGDRQAIADFRAYLTRRAQEMTMNDAPAPRLLDCGHCYEEQGQEVHPHPDCPIGQPPADHTPPAADGLPAGTLEAAEIGASRLDAWARTPQGRNFLAHALVQLARTGWLRTEPGEGFEPMRDREPAEPADVEHCVHDRAVHVRHHHQPVTGCPWCAAREQP